jgi:hypothetical protein
MDPTPEVNVNTINRASAAAIWFGCTAYAVTLAVPVWCGHYAYGGHFLDLFWFWR